MEPQEIEKLYRAYPRQVYSLLDTSSHGLTAAEVEERRKKYGPNKLAKAKKKPLWKTFVENFISPMALLLWAAGIISLVASFLGKGTSESLGPVADPQMMYLAIAIWLVNIINGIFSFLQQFKAGKSTEALAKMLPTYARVIRDGQEVRVEAEELVPGDIIVLSEGDRISADARILLADDLTCAQSALDGEATPSRKTLEPLKEAPDNIPSAKNLVFAGTAVATGSARCAVYATGMNTEFGKIATLTQDITPKQSTLQREIDRTTKIISIIAGSIGLVVFILGVVINGISQNSFTDPTTYLTQFVFALGMVTAFIPEGLSPTVTLSLAKAVQRMAKEGALIKSLTSVETLGSTTVICSDKTGTLTKNEMTVKSLYLNGAIYTVTGDGYAPEGDILAPDGHRVTGGDDRTLQALLTAGGLCSDAKLVPPDPADPDARWTVLGDPTEACLSVSAEKGLVSPGNMQNLLPRIRELNFDSVRKMMTTIHQLDEPIRDCQRLAFTKGAPKEVISQCTRIMIDGQVRDITPADVAAAMKQNDAYASEGLRVLAMACRLLPKSGEGLPIALSDYKPENIENNLVFLGLQAMQDPPRDGIKEAIAECHRAGIRVIMVTGDYGLTAKAIAKKIGIIDKSSVRVITGAELYRMEDADLRDALKDEVIFARMAPEQKYRVVSCLQELGHIVAVTGDGVNDAPALKKADIGVAMGIAGTDVAKDAADMILTDDNFASIVKAIREGRAVFANIRRFITYIFNSNVPEAIPFLLPLVTFNAVPQMITIMEVLLVDIGTDLTPALGLGVEPPDDGVMSQPPRPKDAHLIDRKLLGRAGYYGLQTSILSLGAYFLYNLFQSQTLGMPFTIFSAQTVVNGAVDPTYWMMSTAVVLASIVFCQIGMGFNCRSEGSTLKRGLLSNRLMLIGVAVEIVLLFVVIFTPWINEEIFQAQGPTVWQIWPILLSFPFVVFGLEELRKRYGKMVWARVEKVFKRGGEPKKEER